MTRLFGKRALSPRNNVVNFKAFWPHLTPAVTTESFQPLKVRPSPHLSSRAAGSVLPHYSRPSHSSYGAAPAYFCTAPKKHREGFPGWTPLKSGPLSAPSRARPPQERSPRPRGTLSQAQGLHPLAGPKALLNPPNPHPPPIGSLTQTRPGAERLNGREKLPAFYWLSLLSIIITRPHVAVLVIAIRRAVTSPTRARPALTPLRAVCKGNTAVKRAAGRSQ